MTEPKKIEWLNRTLNAGPFLTLCLNEGQFAEALADLKLKPRAWLGEKSGKMHKFTNDRDELCIVVCTKIPPDATGIEIAGLFVHEAVHVFQAHCDDIGEYQPSGEFEAYAIQIISQRLMWEYERQMA